MATTPEGKVKKAVKALLDAAGAYSFRPVSNGMGAMGVPDVIGVLRGRFIGVEVKAGKGKPTELQLQALRRIHEAGGLALIINETNLDYLSACLEKPRSAESNYHLFVRKETS